jgi:hypothetical protein
MTDLLTGATDWVRLRLQRRRIRRRFREATGIEGDFENPRSHQEKVQFRKLYGNHAFYAAVADKYRVRDYVADKVGERYLVPLLGVFDRLRPEDFAPLPRRFVIKANHGCKWHEIVRDKSRLDIPATVRRFNRYMRATYGVESGERHYALIRPRIVIEELLPGPDGGCPWDYCFFSYNSPQGFDYAWSLVAPDGRSAAFTREGEVLSSQLSRAQLARHREPRNFEEMVEVARLLSADFDFVRVDLYNIEGQVFFGELTCTPHQGYAPVTQTRRQRLRDEMWHLDALNPRLYRAPAAFRYPGPRSTRPGRAPVGLPAAITGTPFTST